jgi:hypothetical protein
MVKAVTLEGAAFFVPAISLFVDESANNKEAREHG